MILSKIKNVKDLGILPTYDIEIDNKSHLYFGNGIAISNSHAISYAVTAYRCAYLKVHFPTEFFCSWLTYSKYKQDSKEEILELVQNAKLNRIEVLPPNIKKKNLDFQIIEDRKVIFGLSHIRGVGGAAIDKIQKVDISTLPKFIKSFKKLGKTVTEGLIKSGACDCYGMSRQNLLRIMYVVIGDKNASKDTFYAITPLTKNEYDAFIEFYEDDIKGALQKIVDKGRCVKRRIEAIESKIKFLEIDKKDTATNNSIYEKIYLGVNLSCSAADDVEIDTKDTKTCRQIFNNPLDKKIKTNVVIDKILSRKTGPKSKNPGSEYCYLSVSDNTGALNNIVCWPETYDKYKDGLREGIVVKLTAKIDSWQGRQQINVQQMEIIG